MKKRIAYIDLAKGIAMLMVVYTHITDNYYCNFYANTRLYIMTESMFMPIFFIMSGLFFSTRLPFKQWIKHKGRRLVVPYLCFYILSYLASLVFIGFGHVHAQNSFRYTDIFQVFYRDVFSNSAIWFLLALFWASAILYIIIRCVSNRWARLAIVVIFGGIGIALGHFRINIPLYIDSAFTALPFVFIGYICKEHNLISRVEAMQKKQRIILMIAVFLVGTIIDYLFGWGASMVRNLQPGPLRFYGCGIAGSFALIALCNIIGHLPLVSFIGVNTLTVLCTHDFVIHAILLFCKYTPLGFYPTTLIILLIVCLSYYIIVPFMKRCLPWMIGEPKLAK